MRAGLVRLTALFVEIFAQNLDLREIARKLVPNFYNFAHENISELNFRKTDPCFSFRFYGRIAGY